MPLDPSKASSRARRRAHLGRGQQAEELACRYLIQRGLQLVARNVRTRRGELDLVMRDVSHLIFVEVRYRSDHRFGLPEETVTPGKRARLIAAAGQFLQHNAAFGHLAVRFDVVAVSPGEAQRPQIHWIADAFTVV